MKVYRRISSLIQARNNCLEKNNSLWLDRHSETLNQVFLSTAPSGAGFDCGTKLSDDSTPEKLVLDTSYHHMDDGGGYDGWTEHRITVRPSLQFGFTLSISGRNRKGIKDYIHEVFYSWLDEETTL